MKRKIRLEDLTTAQIENITKTAEKRKNVPLIKSKQVNMRIDPVHLERLKLLAKKCGEKYTTLMTRLLMEDIDRIWSLKYSKE